MIAYILTRSAQGVCPAAAHRPNASPANSPCACPIDGALCDNGVSMEAPQLTPTAKSALPMRTRSLERTEFVKQQATFVLLILFIALKVTLPALAETDEERQACVNDALQFCQDAIPDRERVYGCLVSHMDVISTACHTVLAPSQRADQPQLKKQTQGVKGAKGKRPSSKHASKAVSVTSAKHASKAVSGTSAKHASRAVSGTSDRRVSKAVSGTSPKHASKVVSRPHRRPLNLLPQPARTGSKRTSLVTPRRDQAHVVASLGTHSMCVPAALFRRAAT